MTRNNNTDIFQVIAEHTSDIILVVNMEGNIQYISPSVTTTLGYQREEMVGHNAFFALHPNDKENIVQLFGEVLVKKVNVQCEYRALHKNTQVLYLEARVVPVLSDGGDISKVVVVARDISQRKELELSLRKSKERYQLLQRSLNHFSSDLSHVMKTAHLEDRLVQEVNDVLHPENCGIVEKSLSDERNRNPVGTIQSVARDYYIKIAEEDEKGYYLFLQLKDGETLSTNEKIWLETIIRYVSILYDNLHLIEGLINRLEKLTQSKETPTWVLRLLFNLSEKERFHLSSDLHDTVLQDLIHLYRKLECHLGQRVNEAGNHNQLLKNVMTPEQQISVLPSSEITF